MHTALKQCYTLLIETTVVLSTRHNVAAVVQQQPFHALLIFLNAFIIMNQ